MTASTRWIASAKNNPCPICGRVRDGDCRTSGDGMSAICHHPKTDLKPGQVVEGLGDQMRWAFTGNTKDQRAGHFTVHKPRAGSSRVVVPFCRPTQIEPPAPEPTPPAPLPPIPPSLARLPAPRPPAGSPYSYGPSLRVNRARLPNGKKAFFCEHRVDDRWVDKAGPNPWPVFNEPDAIAAGGWILETEGEKCVELAAAAAVVAISQPGHAHQAHQSRERYARLLAAGVLGIVYLADNDAKGHTRAGESAEGAAQAGLPLLVIHAGDIWPLLPAGGSLDDAPGTTDQQLADIEAAAVEAFHTIRQQPDPQPEQPPSDDDQDNQTPDEDLEFGRERLAAQVRNLRTTIDLEIILPPHLARRLITRAAAFPVDPSALLGPLLTSAASVVGTRVAAVVNPSWHEPMVIWAGNILPPSALKTPVVRVFEGPLLDLQEQSFDAHRQLLAGKRDGEPEPPPARRWMVQDATYERIAQILAEPVTCGLLSLQDELGGWFERLEAPSSSGARAGWLSLWSGSAALIDRKVAASSFARRTATSLFGNVQPDRLSAMISGDGGENDDAGDGLWSRFLWCRPPQLPWTYNPDGQSIHREILGLLQQLNTIPTGLDSRTHGLEVRFPPELVHELAAPQWEQWAVMAADESNGSRAAFLGKLRGYSVRLSALLLLISQAETCSLFSQTMTQTAQIDPNTGQWFMELPAAALIAGLTLSEFYLAQFDALQPELGMASGELPSTIAKFVRKVEEKGVQQVTVRDLQRWRLAGRSSMSADDCEALLTQAAETYGFGTVKHREGKRRTVWTA